LYNSKEKQLSAQTTNTQINIMSVAHNKTHAVQMTGIYWD